jgi:hypothetical protein
MIALNFEVEDEAKKFMNAVMAIVTSRNRKQRGKIMLKLNIFANDESFNDILMIHNV